jgi:hypothetical protein
LRSRFRAASLALLVIFCLLVPATPVGAAHAAPTGVAIKLLEAPTNRRDDPRARLYIVDHLAPGTTIRRRVQVENRTAQPQHLRVYAGSAEVGKGGFFFHEGSTPNELTEWISFDQPSFDLPAKSKATATVTIVVPPMASTGERYGVIWAENPAPAEVTGHIGLSNRVGIRIYLDIGLGGEPPSDFEIESLTPGRGPDGRPKVLARVRNTGARALDMTGTLMLEDGPGSLSAGPFPVWLGTTVGPGYTAPVAVYLDKEIPNGPWTAWLTLSSGRVERTATATITFPDSGMGAPVPVNSEGVAMPVLVGAAGGMALIAIAGLLFTRLRRRRRDRDKVA